MLQSSESLVELNQWTFCNISHIFSKTTLFTQNAETVAMQIYNRGEVKLRWKRAETHSSIILWYVQGAITLKGNRD